MIPYQIESLPLKDALLLHVPRHMDQRGFFLEAFRQMYAHHLHLPVFVQDNVSFSIQGVLRGLHFQKPPSPQAKLVTVLRGRIWDVIVDLRPSSPSYRRWHGITLTDREKYLTWIYVPVGFAHGFYVESEEALVWYKCSAPYEPSLDGGWRWNDPTFQIEWPCKETPILSAKDAQLPFFSDKENPFRDL
ncbi:MAG: dTDP-4-dehydrorhamnose 3,5-epimerase [Bacteroidia bacterium]|nr:dTDP-4-dehydrorhamnose 3,5-epimerase [Bacteroidia bacterium]MDW8015247.1 dTDP-4-dehydrorhamnose 3,5-epimerase [Bacteroidia bacterium]